MNVRETRFAGTVGKHFSLHASSCQFAWHKEIDIPPGSMAPWTIVSVCRLPVGKQMGSNGFNVRTGGI